MKKIRFVMAGVVSLAFLGTGCATYSPVINSVDVTQIDYSTPLNKSTDCAYHILMFIGPFGQASMVDAIKKGGFSKVKALEYSSSNYLLWRSGCVVVHGE